jgi:hypothetical protein
MKKLLVLFIAISFLAGFSLIGCGPSAEPPKPAPKEEAKPAAPAPEPAKDAPAAAAPEKAAPAAPEKAPEPAKK